MGVVGLSLADIKLRRPLPVSGAIASPVSNIFTDNFARADSALDSDPNWTVYLGSPASFSIVGQKVNCTGSGKVIPGATVAPDTGSTDHFAEVTVGAAIALAGAIMPCIRISADGSCVGIRQTTVGYDIFQRNSAGTYANLVTGTGGIAVGDVVRVYAVGSTVTILRNGVVHVTATTTSLTGTLAGFFLRSTSNSAVLHGSWRSGAGTGA